MTQGNGLQKTKKQNNKNKRKNTKGRKGKSLTRNNNTKKNSKFTYNYEHYSSGDGMLTSVWGPSLWHVLHTISFNYPIEPSDEQKVQYRNFILQLQHVLPCKYCRINLVKNFHDLPLHMEYMENRETFSKYVYDLHELINKMLKKKSGLSYDDVRERYEHFRARCSSKKKTRKLVGKGKQLHKNGCTDPISTIKSKGVVQIVPITHKCPSLNIDNRCMKTI